jgi:hypothetical protein
MARTVETIKASIESKMREYPSLDSYKFPSEGGSKTGVINIIVFVVASAIYTFELLLNIFKADIQAVADSAISGNSVWLQAQLYKFQYGDQIEIVDFVPQYPIVNESKRIITRCSIADTDPIEIKLAKGTPPSLEALTTEELDAVKDYYFGTSQAEGIGFAGVNASITSAPPDRLKVEADIYYQGQFAASVVKENVIAAIDNYLAIFQNTNFNGTIFMIELTDAIQEVEGVTRVEYTLVQLRDHDDSIPGTDVDFQGIAVTAAGYVISEDTASHTLEDTITMIAETA